MSRTESCDQDLEESSISIGDGLSAESLEALFSFIQPHILNEDYRANTSEMSEKIEEMLDSTKQRSDPDRTLLDIESSSPIDAVENMGKIGVVRLNDILSCELCDECLSSINASHETEILNGTDHFSDTHATKFGNVDSNEMRWDMYLEFHPFKESFKSMLGNPHTVLVQNNIVILQKCKIINTADVYPNKHLTVYIL